MKRILCFGDSNTYGANPDWSPAHPEVPNRLPADVRWPGLLKTMLGTEAYEIIEEGLCGRTTIYRDHAWPWCEGRAYLTPCLLSHYPLDLIVVMLGTNDLKAVYAPCADSLGLAMDEFLKIMLNPFLYPDGKVPKILLVCPVRIGDNLENSFMYGTYTEQGRKVSHQLPAVYGGLAKRYGCAFLDAGEFAEPSWTDSIHMTPENHKKLADAMEKKIREIL